MMCRIETVLQVRGESLPIAYELRLGQQSRRLEVRLSLENVSENHRLRLLFPTDIESETAVADGQFDQVARSIVPKAKFGKIRLTVIRSRPSLQSTTKTSVCWLPTADCRSMKSCRMAVTQLHLRLYAQ